MSLGLRERKKAKLRNQIAETTKELILERGYDNTTVEEIARRVEVSPPTFYNYFAGKDAVLGHISIEQRLGWASLVDDRLKGDEPTEEKLCALAARYAWGLTKDPKLFRALILHATYDSVDDATHREAERTVDHSFVDLIRNGQERGELSKEHAPELLDVMIQGVLGAISRRWALGQLSDDELKAMSETAIAVIVHGMKPQ